MSRNNEIRNIIYKFFIEKMAEIYPDVFPLDADGFSEKIYWAQTRDESAEKPYIILTNPITRKIAGRYEKINETTQRENWSTMVTFQVYTQATSGDYSTAENAAKDYAEMIEEIFNNQQTFWTLQNDDIIIREDLISEIRNLSSIEETNYSFRHELDITFEYDKLISVITEKSQDVQIDIKNKGE